MHPQNSGVLGIGISVHRDLLVVAARRPGVAASKTTFPANALGVAALRVFLTDCGRNTRLAMGGPAALELALGVTAGLPVEAHVLSSMLAGNAVELAAYAGRAV